MRLPESSPCQPEYHSRQGKSDISGKMLSLNGYTNRRKKNVKGAVVKVAVKGNEEVAFGLIPKV
jgi:hypothetical protein